MELKYLIKIFIIIYIIIIHVVHTHQNNSGPNLTGESEIIANRIYIYEEGQPVDVKDLFVSSAYVSDNAYTKAEVDNLLVPKANAADVYTKSQTDMF